MPGPGLPAGSPGGPGCGPRPGHATRPRGARPWASSFALRAFCAPRRMPGMPIICRIIFWPSRNLVMSEPDLADRDARAGRDPRPPRAVDDLRVAGARRRRHRVHDRRRPVQVLVADLAEHLPVLRRAGQHAQQVPDRPELAHHGQLLDEVLEREALARGQLARPSRRPGPGRTCARPARSGSGCRRGRGSATPSGRDGRRSKSSSFSPDEANMTGLPVTWAMDRAAPPRASPSSLVRTTPS